MPLENENIQAYCKRLIDQKIKHENPILIGVSLGGILVQEIAEQILVSKIIIVSSIKTNKEMPLRMRWAKKTKLYKLLPTRIVRYFGLLSKLPLPSKIINRIKLYIENKGGTIISTEYIGVKTNIMCECAKKHKC